MSEKRPDKAKKSRKTASRPEPPSVDQASSSTKRAQVQDTAIFSLGLLANISEGSDILSPLKAACLATKSILEAAQAIDNNQEEWNDLKRRLVEQSSTLEEQLTLFTASPLEDGTIDSAISRALVNYGESLKDMHDMVDNLQKKRSGSKLGFLKAFINGKVDVGEILKLNRDIEHSHRLFMDALSVYTSLRLRTIEETTKATSANVETILTDADNAAILQLPTSTFIPSSVHRTCLNGTREAVLQTIWEWAKDDASENPIFWLCDIAGSGKSTVAMSAAETWQRDGILGGQFFFSLASSEGSTTDKFCSTVARDLVHYIPELAPHIAAAVKQKPSIVRCSLEEQFQTLVTGPLQQGSKRVILVLDALDECKSAEQRRKLLEMLFTAVRDCKNLKIFMTSRPDPIIESALGSLAIKTKLEDRLHDVHHRDNVDDIAVYIHQSLDGVLSVDQRQRLVEKADRLFIWASTACRMLTSQSTFSSPQDIYDDLVSMDQAGAIENVYDLVFERVDPEFYTVISAMLGLLLVAFEPLTAGDLDDLLKHASIRGSAEALVRNLGSVLTKDATTNLLQFRHPTVVEYLRRRSSASPTPDNRNRIRPDIVNMHGQAASWCLKSLMSRTEGLKFNICQLESSFHLNRQIPDIDTRISRFISRRLRYASSHWLFHLAETGDDWRRTLENGVKQMTQTLYVLPWMEILSFTGGVPRAIAGLRAVADHTGVNEETSNRITEIRRFIMAFSVPIQDSAPHIYISALPFIPKRSKIRLEALDKYMNTLKVTQGLDEMYPGLPRTLRGHILPVTALAFSSDGSRFTSGSEDTTIQLWDAETGQPLGEPLRGHEGSVMAVAFSPDGSRIVSGSSDMTVRMWNAVTGQPSGQPLRGHEHYVTGVAFSPDGSRVISGSLDTTIRLWDATTGQPLGDPLRDHGGFVWAVAFSPDGSRIASGSSDQTIRVWDAETSQLVELLRGHEGPVTAVAFSPNGSQIVSGSQDMTIQLWEAQTSRPVGNPLRGHSHHVTTVAFSPDGSRIASGSKDNTIRMWDAANRQPLGESLQGHEGPVRAVEFSPDSSRIVSGSDDGMIRFWDSGTGQSLGELLQGHQAYVTAVAFSPDGSKIISGSDDMTIRMWDAGTGQALGQPLRGHEDYVTTVAFSPDGTRIASGSNDMTIRMWDAGTGQMLGEPLQGHGHNVTVVAFSPDGSRIVSGSEDTTIQLWDAETGQPLEPFYGHVRCVKAVAFSPDGSRIVSGSHDHTIRFWDARTGRPLGEPVRGHDGPVMAIAFSPDGSRIASGSEDETIRIWDTVTGQLLGEPLRGHDWYVMAVAFSPDGSQIVSGAFDYTIRLWDAGTGQPLGQPLRGHQSYVSAVAFSPDGSRIASGSLDKTVCLWSTSAITSQRNSNQDDKGLEDSRPPNVSGVSLRLRVPGFEQCSLLRDGWVQSSGKYLFWVPPENRHGLEYPHLLTMPTTSSLRATKLDFTRFRCGLSWTKVRNDTYD
ncbi:Vegetative incompatibility protein HET-E-1 [Serendipita indica DSM 11827]|nr:Vegetative incompatibility protein HET-E-1 [Serendipita indica DSM 11827]